MTTTSTTTTTNASLEEFLVGFARSRPFWLPRFFLVYLGNPFVFLPYFIAVALLSPDDDNSIDGVRIFGFKPFVKDDTEDVSLSVARMNFVLFVLVTLPLYLLWFWVQVRCAIPLLCRLIGSSRTLNLTKFCLHHCTCCCCILALPGFLNVLVFSTVGMAGDALGFIFGPLLVLATIPYIISWFVALCYALEHHQQGPDDDDYAAVNSGDGCDEGECEGIACATLA
jgi:hypothetical protein